MLRFNRLFASLAALIILFSSLSAIYASAPLPEKEEIDTYKVALSALKLTDHEELAVDTQQANPSKFAGFDLLISWTPDNNNQSAHKFSFLLKGDHEDMPAEIRAQGVRLPLIYKAATYSEPYRLKSKFTFQEKVSTFDMLFDPQKGITIYHALTPFDLTVKGTTVINGIPENHFGLIYTPALLIEAKTFDNAYGGVIAKKGMDITTIDGVTNGRGSKKMVPYPIPGTSNATLTKPYYEPDESYISCDGDLQLWGKKIINNFSAISAGGNFTVHDGCELLFNRGGSVDIKGSATIFADNIQIYQERDAVDYDVMTPSGRAWGKALLDQSAIPVFRIQGDAYFRTETIQLMVPKDTSDPLFVGGKMGTANKTGQVAKLMRHTYEQVAIKYERPALVMPDLSGMMSGFGLENTFGSFNLGSPSFTSSSFTSSHDLRVPHTSSHPLNFNTTVGNVNVSVNLGQFTNQVLAHALKTDEQTVNQMMSMFSSKSSISSSNNSHILNWAKAIPKAIPIILGAGKELLPTATKEAIKRNLPALRAMILASKAQENANADEKKEEEETTQNPDSVRNDDPKNAADQQHYKKELTRNIEALDLEAPKKKPKGVNHPNTKKSLDYGNQKHKEFHEQNKQRHISKPLKDADGSILRPDLHTDTAVHELKPGTTTGVKKGLKQIERYQTASDKPGLLHLYEPKGKSIDLDGIVGKNFKGDLVVQKVPETLKK